MLLQSKKAAEEAKLVKKQEESEAVRQAHREEARLKEEVTRHRLEAKVTSPTPHPTPCLHTTPPLQSLTLCGSRDYRAHGVLEQLGDSSVYFNDDHWVKHARYLCIPLATLAN